MRKYLYYCLLMLNISTILTCLICVLYCWFAPIVCDFYILYHSPEPLGIWFGEGMIRYPFIVCQYIIPFGILCNLFSLIYFRNKKFIFAVLSLCLIGVIFLLYKELEYLQSLELIKNYVWWL